MTNGEIFVKVYGNLCVPINALSVFHPFSNCLKTVCHVISAWLMSIISMELMANENLSHILL